MGRMKLIRCCIGAAVVACVVCWSTAARGDDSAASIAAGGLVPRREARIVMAKEVLTISLKKVTVEYDFRNDTDENVTTEIAFPIPPYQDDWVEQDVKAQSFSDFRLWVDGKPKSYAAEAKAFLRGKDVTSILKAAGVDIVTFGHLEDAGGWAEAIRMADVDRLSPPEKKRLERLGLITPGPDVSWANWMVHLQYHWTQEFPAHSVVHIRHEYTPVVGFQYIPLSAFQSVLHEGSSLRAKPLRPGRTQDDTDLLLSFCPDSAFLRGSIGAIQADTPDLGFYAYPEWVDFILTSANTWRTPIEDFTLIVDRTAAGPAKRRDTLISFCSPGHVEKMDEDHFRVHLTNFVPKEQLHIGFFGLPARGRSKAVPK